ncbi:unnamed protein product, partial [Candidula unifasciata]
IQSFNNGAINKITLVVKGDVHDTAGEVKSAVVEYLEWIKDTIGCVECCIRHVLAVPGTVELSWVQSLPFCAVHVLKEAYAHCKDSTSLYGDLLHHVGSLLAELFKRTHSLQVSLVKLLEKLSITGAQLEDHVHVLCSVCSGLFEICGIVTCLDVKLVIGLWKAIIKLCSQHIRLLRDRFDACPLINSLCEEIRQGYQYLFELSLGADALSLSQGDDKTFSKSCKILAFQMKVLVALLRDFTDYLGNCEKNVLDLLLVLHRYLPPSLCAKALPPKLESEVRVQVVSATAPILGHLVQNRVFRAALTSFAEERIPEDRLPRLLVQLMLLDMLPRCEADVIEFWLSPVNHMNPTPTRGLLSAIFDSVQECEVEMQIPAMLPGVMVAGKPQRQVSLYEFTTTHLCGFIGACPAKHFSVLEHTLLENVLRDNDLSYVIALDCWCFLVRYGTAVTCRDQVQTLILAFKQLKKISHKLADKLSFLIHRLVKFMSPDHQSALVKQFSPSDEPCLWISLGTSCLNDSLSESVRHILISWALSVLQTPAVKALEVLNTSRLFADLLKDRPLSECMSHPQQVLLVNNVCNIWSVVLTSPQMPGPIRELLIVRLLQVTTYLLPDMEAGDILKVLTIVQSSVKTAQTSDVAVAAAGCLLSFGHVRIAPLFQSQVLNRLCQLFNSLLSHPDPLVHHRALEAFVQFASETMYVEAVEACLQGNEALQIRVEHFQNRIPYQSSQKEFVLVDYLISQMSQPAQEEAVATTGVGSTAADVSVEVGDEGITVRSADATTDVAVESCQQSASEHPAKRARLSTSSSDLTVPASQAESSRPETYQKFLETLSTVARDMELEFRQAGPPPPSFVDAVKEALTRISFCMSSHNNWFDSLS